VRAQTDLGSPGQLPDSKDPGDDVQRRFRYQHAYGAILLVAGASGKEPWVRVFCEQHEDLLCERSDGTFDAYQVKTRGPEGGYWELTHSPLRKSIKRFVALRAQFGGRIRRFVFVSNSGMRTQPTESERPPQRARDPWTVLRYVREGPSGAQDDDVPAALDALATDCGCDRAALIDVLHDVRLVPGPSLVGFEAQVAHDHLPQLPECESLSPVRLNEVRDELIQRVYLASSLAGISPAAQWTAQDGTDGVPATVEAKGLSIDVVTDVVQTLTKMPLRFLPAELPLDVIRGGDPDDHETMGVLTQKMQRGGIGGYLAFMKRLGLSAEARLTEIAISSGTQVVDQLAGVVESECTEARVDSDLATPDGQPYGKTMFQGVRRRLGDLADADPRRVHRQDKDCLTGIAAILSEDCRVWWSDPFDLDLGAE
jgi:hypothetical protein